MRIARTLLAALLIAAPGGGASAAELEKLWELDGLKWPESAAPDASGETIYVSNVDGDMRAKDGKGAISKVSADGRMIEADWVTGLNAPKGLALAGGTLYVADIDEIVAIDVATAKPTKRWKVEGAVFLNDVATAPDGRVFVSDTMTNTIWLIQGEDVLPWLKHDRLNGPNGLLVEDDRLVVAPIGTLPKDGDPGQPAHLVTVAFADKTIRDLGDGNPVGFLDGLVALGAGSYLVGDFGRGPIHRVSSSGQVETMATLPASTADMGYVAPKRLLVVPHSSSGKLIGYRVPETR
ncbi:SMP-30/gluconolactonase/LRE family protein [Hansschlegelia sp. KR7-227]|uniref:SMP-30/gluconolactonase/LRE family protein n=1 Tax=Hansschlegelia sp. KR7-227 TaxID=3400914 RepID=UPI003BFD1BC3